MTDQQRCRKLLLAGALILGIAGGFTQSTKETQDWPQYLGPERNGTSPEKGSMILIDGLILATDGRKTLYLIEPDPSGFKPLTSSEALQEGGTSDNDPLAQRIGGVAQNWAPVALSNGKLLIRDQSRLLCVRVAK